MDVKWLGWVWAAPITLVGLLFATVIRASSGQLQHHGNAWEATGGCAPWLLWLMNPWLLIEAITFGHVIIARDAMTARRVRAHEQVHVCQYERWGVLFPIAYLAASVMAILRGECPYRGNRFEREAFLGQNGGDH
jgi:hypothetical protein